MSLATMNETSIPCVTVKYLADSVEMKILLIARCIMTVSSIILFFILFKVQGTYLEFHSNARWLLICHHFWAISLSTANFIAHVFDLARYYSDYDSSCDFLLTTPKAVIIRGATVLTLYGQIFACAAMVIERLFATIQFRTYEMAGNTLAKILILLQCLLSSALFYVVIENLDWSEMKSYSSISSSRTSQRFTNNFTILGVIEFISLIAFIGLLQFNKYKKKQLAQASLTEKYQVSENIRAIQLFIPIVLTHFCFFMPMTIIFPIYTTYINPKMQNPKAFAMFLEVFNTAPIYPFVLPLVLFWRHRVLRENLRTAIGWGKAAVAPDTVRSDGRTEEQVQHFQALAEMWALPKYFDNNRSFNSEFKQH